MSRRNSKSRSRPRRSRSRPVRSSSLKVNEATLEGLLSKLSRSRSRSRGRTTKARKTSSRGKVTASRGRRGESSQRLSGVADITRAYKRVSVTCNKSIVPDTKCNGKKCNDSSSVDYNDGCCKEQRDKCMDVDGNELECQDVTSPDFESDCCVRKRLCATSKGTYLESGKFKTRSKSSKSRKFLQTPKGKKIRCPQFCAKGNSISAVICRNNQARCGMRRKNNKEFTNSASTYDYDTDSSLQSLIDGSEYTYYE